MIAWLSRKPGWAFSIYVLLDIICVGMGMGVPIFCILFGFVVGWVGTGIATARWGDAETVLGRLFRAAWLTSGITFIGMVLLWGPVTLMLLDPASDFVKFGIPLILYGPKASFIGWLVLMIFISPFLQLLTTLLGGHVRLLFWLKAGKAASGG